MKEIGGYFGLEQLPECSYYPDLIPVNSARNGLVYILKARSIRKIHIPYYLCDTVARVCDREGIAYARYHTDRSFQPVFDEKGLGENEYLYIVNYFGQLDDQRVNTLKERYGRIILDNVQAFFQRPLKGVDTVYSCRKFFGVPDGGYISTDVKLQESLPEGSSAGHTEHLTGRYENSASGYYVAFRRSEDRLYEEGLRSMSKTSRNLLGAVDYGTVRKRREDNFRFLNQQLKETNRLDIVLPAGPYAYPYCTEDGMSLKKRLAEKKIYVPTLWPEAAEFGGTEKDYVENILPLPCDQRYDLEDMRRIVEEIRNV